jgi:orotate phosphoribosyltransferase
MLTAEEMAEVFEKTSALLTGHFLLTSGLHSEKYLQCARVLQWPGHTEKLAQALAEKFLQNRPDVILSPAIGGITIGYEVGRILNCRSIFSEREEGKMNLRRGFIIHPDEKVLVVEDVVTTGGSTRETMEVAQSRGGVVIGAASIVDRSGGKTNLGVPFYSLWTLSVPTYSPEQCPWCRAGSQPVKPGSRK